MSGNTSALVGDTALWAECLHGYSGAIVRPASAGQKWQQLVGSAQRPASPRPTPAPPKSLPLDPALQERAEELLAWARVTTIPHALSPPLSVSPGDELLRWISEVQGGRIESFYRGALWLAGERGHAHIRPGYLMTDLQAAGYTEVRWGDRRSEWCVAPPAIVRLPNAGGAAVLTGGRRQSLLVALHEQAARLGIIVEATDGGLHRMFPATIWLTADSPDILHQLADAIGAI